MTRPMDGPPLLSEAERSFEAGEYYRARKMTQRYIEEHPEDMEAQALMAAILAAEIGRQKEVLQSKAPEEFSEKETEIQAKTWIERAEMLLNRQQYAEALEAAEKVFIYDAGNVKASYLVDEINKRASKDGAFEAMARKRIYQSEIDVRVEGYLDQAEQQLATGRLAQAKLTIEKILLLAPGNQQAEKLYEQVKQETARRGT